MWSIATSTMLAALFASGSVIPVTLPSTAVDAVQTVTTSMEQADVDALVLPSIVRVYHHVVGTLSIRPFWINFETLRAEAVEGDPIEKQLDDYVTGTGFAVSDAGLVVTNAHVVSSDTIVRQAAAGAAVGIMGYQIQKLIDDPTVSVSDMEAIKERFDAILNDPNGAAAKAFRASLLTFVSFTDAGSSLTLVHQGEQPSTATIESILRLGTDKVQVKYIDEQWAENHRDIAILRISEPSWKLPALEIDPSDGPLANSEVTVFGFPGSTDLSNDSALHVTETRGRITSTKRSSGATFDMYQTDAKIGQGSSGGPAVNTTGHLVGVVTLQSGTDEGDNFGFILPVSLIREGLRAMHENTLSTGFSEAYRAGLDEQSAHHCKKAVEYFADAQSKLGASFSTTKQRLDAIIATCNDQIAQGLSIDSTFDEYRARMRALGTTTWVIVIVLVVVLIGGVAGTRILIRRMRTEEQVIDTLQHELTVQEATVERMEHEIEQAHSADHTV